ncbi:phenylalanine ammonia-lyase, partial [Aureobasidium melanogenum]
MLNGGLPANLCADEPSLSFTCKGIDINMASYQAELGFLANPVGNHVQSAEMHNQAINSLALISSRYTFQALDTIYLMAAAHLFVLCQAFDLRVLQNEFLKSVKAEVENLDWFTSIQAPKELNNILKDAVYTRIKSVWTTTNTADLDQRCKVTANSVMPDIINTFAKAPPGISIESTKLVEFTTELQAQMKTQYERSRQSLFDKHQTITPTSLGNAAKRMYKFVRGDLGVKLHRGLIEYPTQPVPPDVKVDEPRRNIGSRVSVIYEALRDGRGSAVLMEIVEESLREEET